tara:strand:+ start:206 stop:412 length:207 start_codon:yes stop_codon:yes gene_type:complete
MDLETRVNNIKARISRMYTHLGYDKNGIHKIDSTPVEEKSKVLEVDRTPENTAKDAELDALRRALTKR